MWYFSYSRTKNMTMTVLPHFWLHMRQDGTVIYCSIGDEEMDYLRSQAQPFVTHIDGLLRQLDNLMI